MAHGTPAIDLIVGTPKAGRTGRAILTMGRGSGKTADSFRC